MAGLRFGLSFQRPSKKRVYVQDAESNKPTSGPFIWVMAGLIVLFCGIIAVEEIYFPEVIMKVVVKVENVERSFKRFRLEAVTDEGMTIVGYTNRASESPVKKGDIVTLTARKRPMLSREWEYAYEQK